VNLATVAAFTAAGVALIVGVFNVVWGARLSSRAQLEQWRRNEERPIVARVLTLSQDARTQWELAFRARENWQLERGAWQEQVAMQPESQSPGAPVDPSPAYTEAQDEAIRQFKAGSDVYDKLRYETAQLGLIARAPVREVAAGLVGAHVDLRAWLAPGRKKRVSEERFYEQAHHITRLERELVDRARADLGLTTSDG
jgi:hypothetical protein